MIQSEGTGSAETLGHVLNFGRCGFSGAGMSDQCLFPLIWTENRPLESKIWNSLH